MHSTTYIRLIQSREWKQLRAACLTEHPLCERCKQLGYIRAARCVHHLTPVESARTEQEAARLCFSPSNLQALCYDCHAEIHRLARSHSKQVHQQRQQQALQRWIDRAENRRAKAESERQTFPTLSPEL